MNSFGAVLKKENFSGTNNEKFIFAYQNKATTVAFLISSSYITCHSCLAYSSNRFRSIIDRWNQKPQSTGTLRRKRHNSLWGHETPQGIRPCRGNFPVTQMEQPYWDVHLSAGMQRGPCPGKVEKGSDSASTKPSAVCSQDGQLRASGKMQQLNLSQA